MVYGNEESNAASPRNLLFGKAALHSVGGLLDLRTLHRRGSIANNPSPGGSGSGTRHPGAPKGQEGSAAVAKRAKWRQRPLSPVGLWALFEARWLRRGRLRLAAVQRGWAAGRGRGRATPAGLPR